MTRISQKVGDEWIERILLSFKASQLSYGHLSIFANVITSSRVYPASDYEVLYTTVHPFHVTMCNYHCLTVESRSGASDQPPRTTSIFTHPRA